MRLKPVILALGKGIVEPIKKLAKILLSGVLVPLYKIGYGAKKQADALWRPAKNRVMVFVTNRYAVHVTAVIIAISVTALNIGTSEVRAETFGEKSLMYAIATNQDIEIIEEYAINTEQLDYKSLYYRPQTALSSAGRGVAGGVLGEGVSVSMISGGALTAPAISEGAASVAPRTEIEVYTVQQGDTLSTIAAKFGISLNTLLWANNLTVNSSIKPGGELTILPTTGVRHTVASGDTITKIATKYKAEASEIVAFNRLADNEDIVIGEQIIVPNGEIAAVVPVRRPTSVTSVFTPRPTTSSTIPTQTTTPATTTPTVSATGSMVWPTDLRVITQYYGWSHTGLDIDCHFTHDNYAADAGVVQFAGWKGGYGYTVEVNHGNGMVTRYAHHKSMYVTPGQQVAKGQAVGLCGTTGRSTGTHLHFEVIINGAFKNPLDYIR